MDKKQIIKNIFVTSIILIIYLFMNRGFNAIEVHGTLTHKLTIFLLTGIGILTLILLINNKLDNKILTQNKLVWILLAYCLLSVTWSHQVYSTLEKTSILISFTIIGFYIYKKYNYKERIELIANISFLWLLANLFVILIIPSTGISNYFPGAWEGIYNHKNVLGKVSAISSLFLFFALLEQKNRSKKIIYFIGIALSVLLTIKSDSASAIIALMSIIFLTGFFRLMQKIKSHQRRGILLILFIIFTILTITIATNLSTITELIGKDSTLTGRTEIWVYVLEEIKKSPIKGFGLGAFWQGYEGPSEKVNYKLWDPAPHAHNGFIETYIETGLIGLIIFVILILSLSVQSYEKAMKNKDFKSLSSLIFILVFIIYNIPDSLFLRVQSGIYFIWLIITIYQTNEK